MSSHESRPLNIMAEEDSELGRAEVDLISSSNSTAIQGKVSDLANLKCLIDDDVFQALKKHFHMSGKGRRPDLPKGLTVTRRLLVQLFFVKEEGQESFQMLKAWLEKLVPNMSTVTVGRIKHRVQSILESCLHMSPEETCQFLKVEHDFHALAPTLAALGLNRLHLVNEDFSHLPAQNRTLKNDVIICLDNFRSQERLPTTFITHCLRSLSTAYTTMTDKQLKSKALSVLDKAKTLSRNKKKVELNVFLESEFLKLDDPKTPDTTPFANKDILVCQECSLLRETLDVKEKNIKILESDNAQMKTAIAELARQIDIKDSLINVDMRQLRENNLKLETCVEELKSDLKNVRAQKDELSKELDKLKNLNCYKKNLKYKKVLTEITSKNNSTQKVLEQEQVKNSGLEATIVKQKTKIKEEQSLKSYYKTSLCKEKKINTELKKMLEYDAENKIVVKLREDGSSHRYSDDIRKTYYALQEEANVSATNCTKVVSTVAKHLFKIDLADKLPSDTSSINFSSEAHVVAKAHVMEEIKNSIISSMLVTEQADKRPLS